MKLSIVYNLVITMTLYLILRANNGNKSENKIDSLLGLLLLLYGHWRILTISGAFQGLNIFILIAGATLLAIAYEPWEREPFLMTFFLVALDWIGLCIIT